MKNRVDRSRLAAEVSRINKGGALWRTELVERARRIADCLDAGGVKDKHTIYGDSFCGRKGCGYLVRDHARYAALLEAR